MAEKDMPVFDKDKSLQIAISQIEKELGKGSIMRLGETAATALAIHPVLLGFLAVIKEAGANVSIDPCDNHVLFHRDFHLSVLLSPAFSTGQFMSLTYYIM